MLHLILFLLIGALAGYLAGLIMKSNSLGLALNLVVGVLGAVLGGLLFPLLGVSFTGPVATLIMAIAGAATLLVLIGLFKKEDSKAPEAEASA